MSTALKALTRMDLRKVRAQSLAAAVMRAVDPLLDPENPRVRRDAFDAIFEVLWQQGVEVLTDYTRSEARLPPRGEDGWTDDELQALEEARLAVLRRPMLFRVDQL